MTMGDKTTLMAPRSPLKPLLYIITLVEHAQISSWCLCWHVIRITLMHAKKCDLLAPAQHLKQAPLQN